ncbi:hypothetical protein BT93_F1573 [Corymbia citriodora subsp. variegata]|nr:hypothetical protein BT93_F1573 [Corymbia citriodora subsp. variegata]
MKCSSVFSDRWLLSLLSSPMASSSLLSLSATFSRLHFVPKLSLPLALSSVGRSARRNRRRALLSSASSRWSPPSGPNSGSSVSCGGAASAGGDDLVVLGIEMSCDDTAAAVVKGDGKILSQVVSSQADLLVLYGDVAPKMAEAAHAEAIDPVVEKALSEANLTARDLSAVAFTIGPGLSLCLRVGMEKARNIAGLFSKPIVGVHHMEAHALVARLVQQDLQFPFLALLISGGHNLLILAQSLGQYVQLGTTIDDAIGEAYDSSEVARAGYEEEWWSSYRAACPRG